MPEKQKPTPEFRLQTPSIPDLSEGLTRARMRLNRRVKHRGRKLKDGPLLNALMAWFLAQGEEEQARIAEEGLRRYEAMLDGLVFPVDGDLQRPMRPFEGLHGKVPGEGKHEPTERNRRPKARS